MPPADAPVCARTAAPARRGAKIVAARIAGQSVEAIADSEGLTRKRVETMLRDELRRRSVAPAADYARLQIARLEAMAATLAPLAAAGESAGDRPRAEDSRPARPLPRLQQARPRDRPAARRRARTVARQAQCDGRADDRGAEDRAMSEPAKPARKPRARRGDGWRNGGAAPLLRNIGALLVLSPAERAKLLAALSDKQCDEIFSDWSLWARDDQRPPPGDWIYWLILAGRGAGKTRAGAEAVREWVEELRHRQPDRRDPRRRARRDGAGRIRTDGDLPARRAAALRARRRPPRLAERRDVAAVLGRRAGPTARQAA